MVPSGSLDASVLALAERLDIALAFLLLIVRFTTCFSMIPGVGQGTIGLAVRGTAILVLAGSALFGTTIPPVPDHWGTILVMVASEAMLGLVLGIIPQLIVVGAHLAGSLGSTAMGLGAAQLFDPGLGEQASTLGKLYGDFSILVFLLLNGHHTVIYAASGLSGSLPPGVFVLTPDLLLQVTAATSTIFKLGVLISAPIISTLLITQFVLGLLSKTVPSINVFFLSFPLTVGIGLVLAALSLPSTRLLVERGVADMGHLLLNVVGH